METKHNVLIITWPSSVIPDANTKARMTMYAGRPIAGLARWSDKVGEKDISLAQVSPLVEHVMSRDTSQKK